MKHFSFLRSTVFAVTLLCAQTIFSEATANTTNSINALKIGIVNFKQCIEKSKIGNAEKVTFENLKKQIETTLADKEKQLNDLTAKLSDSDYMDSLSNESEADLKHRFKILSQEHQQFQSQYFQTLNQANYTILQKISKVAAEASSQIGSDLKLDLVLNEDNCFFYIPTLDVSDKVISEMDRVFEEKNNTTTSQQ